jgi:cell division protein FtsI (penicillin-binding protein 3)
MATVFAPSDHIPKGQVRSGDPVGLVHGRVMLLLILFLVITLLLVARMAWLGIAGAQPDVGRGAISGIPSRGDIVDRNGVPLARTISGYAITVTPKRLLGDPQRLAVGLNRIFPDTPVATFKARLTGRSWTYLRRRALPEQVREVNALGDPGIAWNHEAERLYPQRTLAAHLIGYAAVTATGAVGGTGAERAFNERLADPARRGTPLALSIDSRVQAALESELYAGMTDQQAIGAVGIVLDARNGEVMAMASLPTFNPNKLENVDPRLRCDQSPRCNRAVQARYELGSTFKPISIAAAMEAGVVTSMSKRYDATAPLKVGGFAIKDDHPLGRWLNVPETLVHSSNIVTARIADELGPARLQTLYRALEFDRRPSLELEERAGTLWPADWGRVTTMTAAYGHGIAVTPLHLASAYAALVNDGVWHPSTILKRQPNEVVPARRVFSSATSARSRQLLRMIVSAGTGRSADAPGYRVGGKTGSAEKPRDGGYSRSSNITSFAAAFPMEEPRYVVLVMMDEPKGSISRGGGRTAAFTAAPVVKAFVTRAAPMLGIYPEANRDVDISGLMPLLGGTKEKE